MRALAIGIIQISFATMLIALGVIALALPLVDALRLRLMALFTSPPLLLVLGGLSLMLLGFILLCLCFWPTRRGYYLLSLHDDRIAVSAKVIASYIKIYFNKSFPQGPYHLDVAMKGNQLLIEADVPEQEDEEKVLKKIEDDLAHLLQSTIGYLPSFQLSIRFQSFSCNR